MRLYSLALALVCSCFFFFFLFFSYIQDSHRRVTPVHVFILLFVYFMSIHIGTHVGLCLMRRGGFFSVQFLSPCLELYLYICHGEITLLEAY